MPWSGPAGDSPTIFMAHPHGHRSHLRLKRDRLKLQSVRDDDRRAEHRVSGEAQLICGREDPDRHLTAMLRGKHEHRLGEPQLAGES